MKPNQAKELQVLEALAYGLQPDWQTIVTANLDSNGQPQPRESKILAQCCKPGPCSPKTNPCRPKS